MKVRKRLFKKLKFFMVMSIVFMNLSVVALAITSAEAEKELAERVKSDVGDNSYQTSGGGSVSGSSLFEKNDEGLYVIDEPAYSSLTSSAQSDFISDVADSSREVSASKDDITDETVDNWWKRLQKTPGAGSKFLNEILKNTTPDFVSANKIFKPFSGIFGTAIGLGAVLLMACLGIVIVADISYIAIPMVRIFVEDKRSSGGMGGGGGGKSLIFSYDAMHAVEEAESGGSGGMNGQGGSNKHAIGIYFKRRVIMLIILGIALLYLVQGQIFVAVGWILDTVSGFLGF